MRWITARRRHPAAGYAVVLLMLVALGGGYAFLTGSGAAAAPVSGPSSESIARGADLFARNCASCHGLQAQGTSLAPSLIGVGAAAVDFQVSTGRMPAKQNAAENNRKPLAPDFDGKPQNIRDVANYIASLAGGPAIPDQAQVSPEAGDVGRGEELFIANCAACHNFVGAGGALTQGKSAPALNQATPTQIYEAMLTGPEAMPNFSDSTLTPQSKRDIIAYVTEKSSEGNPGGFSLGRIGPVTEGLVGFIGGIGVLVFLALWITMKRRES